MFKRILLKLSGEALSSKENAFDVKTLNSLVNVISKIKKLNIDLAIVLGGGNFLRGKELAALNFERTTSDYMGMLATVINTIALETALNNAGVSAKAFSALEIPKMIKSFNQADVIEALKDNKVVIFAGGVGNPYFSTDTCCALRALEIKADTILIAKNGVDGVYDKDPNKFSDAIKFDEITFTQMIKNNLEIIDLSAAILCKENNIDAYIFNMNDTENIIKVLKGENIGTLISAREE